MNKEKKICEYRKKEICTSIESDIYKEKCTQLIHKECYHPDAEGCC